MWYYKINTDIMYLLSRHYSSIEQNGLIISYHLHGDLTGAEINIDKL